jgi:hypothetical protein
MKRIFQTLATAFILIPIGTFAQHTNTETLEVKVTAETDTSNLFNGRLKIISSEKNGEFKPNSIELTTKKDKKRKTVETHWGGFDIGFNNYLDKTNYTAVNSSPSNDNSFLNQMNPPATKRDFELRSGKSIHLNFPIVKQQVSIYKHYVNLVYGITYDINNWSYKNSISWNVGNPQQQLFHNNGFISRDSVSFKKNKLVTNYLQVPLLLKFETNPQHKSKNVTLALGGYAGYLVRSHTKQIVSGSSDKKKQFEDFNLNQFQYGVQAELGFQSFGVYFKHNASKLTDYGTAQYPYAFGIRLAGL